MEPIKISSCQNCLPIKWQVAGESAATYKCDNCRKMVREVLEIRPSYGILDTIKKHI